MTPKQRKKRKAEIAAAIKKAHEEGQYDAAEHLTGLIDLEDGVQEAWLEEAFDGTKALKRAWGKVWQIRYNRLSVQVVFKSGFYLHLKIPYVRQKGVRGKQVVLRYSGPLLGRALYTKLVRAGLVEGLEAFEEK